MPNGGNVPEIQYLTVTPLPSLVLCPGTMLSAALTGEAISSRQRSTGAGRRRRVAGLGVGLGPHLLTAILAWIFDGRIGMTRGSFTTSLTQRSSPSLK